MAGAIVAFLALLLIAGLGVAACEIISEIANHFIKKAKMARARREGRLRTPSYKR